jgi:CelD/BcsL family acetyltransferase involved in cellulose biosynthesis
MSQVEVALAETSYGRSTLSAEVAARADSEIAADDIDLAIHYDLAAAEAEWREVQEQRACTVFQTFEWLSAWHRHIAPHSRAVPCIVVARDTRRRVLFLLPLAVQAAGFARELTWLGSDLCDYNVPLLATDGYDLDPAQFRALWRRIVGRLQADPRSRHDLIRLEKMPATVGGRPNPLLALSTSLNPSGSYLTPLSDDWESFYKAKRSSATRRRDRSKRNHLAEAGEVTFVTADDTASALDALDVLVTQKTATFARHGIRNLFALPGYLDFYKDIAGNLRSRDLVHISTLKVGEQAVAANLGLVFGDRYYHVLASYTDGDLSRWGPGAAHLNDLLRYAIERRLAVFDFTIGDERYKRDWCDDVQPLHDHVSVASLRGAMIAGPAIVLHGLKRTIKQTPLLWAMVVKARAIGAALRGHSRSAAGAARPAESDPT